MYANEATERTNPADRATDQTVRAMQAHVGAAVRSDLTRRTARSIVGQSKCPATAIRGWLRRRVRFTSDPAPGRELLRAPETMLRTIDRQGWAPGDCDDVAMLAAALGLAVGLPARFRLLAFDSPRAPFEHVFTELRCRGRWVELDTTRPAQFPPGLTIQREAIREAV